MAQQLLLQLLRELLRELLRQLLVRHLLGQLLWQLLGKLLMDRGRLHWMPPPVRSTWGSNRTAHRADRSGADGLVLATWCDPRVYGWSQGWAQQPKAEAHSRNGRPWEKEAAASTVIHLAHVSQSESSSL